MSGAHTSTTRYVRTAQYAACAHRYNPIRAQTAPSPAEHCQKLTMAHKQKPAYLQKRKRYGAWAHAAPGGEAREDSKCTTHMLGKLHD